jgi:hypothetical protein
MNPSMRSKPNVTDDVRQLARKLNAKYNNVTVRGTGVQVTSLRSVAQLANAGVKTARDFQALVIKDAAAMGFDVKVIEVYQTPEDDPTKQRYVAQVVLISKTGLGA